MENELSLRNAACPLMVSRGLNAFYNFNGKLGLTINTITALGAGTALESIGVEITHTTDSTYLTGTNITYSGGRGSAALKITSVVSGLGGYHGIYVGITTSSAQVTDGYGTIGIKCVVTNSAAMTDGEVYGGMFIAKHASTQTMTASASLIGLESWAYISSSGPARTVLGLNAAIHNECTGAYGAGSVARVIQVICDNASGAEVPVESTGICIWNMAGTWDNAINIVNSGNGFTNFVKFTNDGAPASSTGTIGGTQAGYIKVLVGSTTHYIQLYPTLS